jgi:cobalt-zinc-cadmium efflux system outer membrane protein
MSLTLERNDMTRSQRLRVRGGTAIALLWLGTAALAQDSSMAALTLDQAIGFALERNPELAALAQEILATDAAVTQAGVLPNPEVAVGGDKLFNARKRESGDQAVGLALQQLVELGGKRGARVRVAEADRAIAGWDFAVRRADLLQRVSRSFVDVLAAQQRLALADESTQLAGQVADAAAKRVQAGKVSPVEETRARVALAGVEVEREQARRDLDAARKRLALLWNERTPRFERAVGTLDQLRALPPYATLSGRTRDNPDLARWSSALAQRTAVLEGERAKAIPDVTVTGGVIRFSNFNDYGYLLGVSVPIPVFNQNRGGILEANRRLDKVADEQRAAEAFVLRDLAATYERVAALLNETATLRTRILPGARSAYDAANKGYLLGKFSFIDVLDAQRTLFEARRQYLRALADYQVGLSELERLVGGPLDTESTGEHSR